MTGFQWISGSFVEDIETLEMRAPRDIDVVTFARRPTACENDIGLWRAFVDANSSLLLGDGVVKDTYKCDAYFVDLSVESATVLTHGIYWFGLFSHRRTGLWKGMLQIPLEVSDDDHESSLIVGL